MFMCDPLLLLLPGLHAPLYILLFLLYFIRLHYLICDPETLVRNPSQTETKRVLPIRYRPFAHLLRRNETNRNSVAISANLPQFLLI